MLKVNLNRLANALKKVDWDPNRLDCVGRDLYRRYKQDMEMIERDINRGIEYETYYETYYYDLIEQMNNTINWNVPRRCKSSVCPGCSSMRVVLTPQTQHHAKYVCNLCHTHHKWIGWEELQEFL